MVIAAGLDLTLCTERFNTVSLSGHYKVTQGYTGGNTILNNYARRKVLKGASLDEYFEYTKNTNKEVKTVPHYVGGSSNPTYPATEGYARSVILKYSPWIGKFDGTQDFIAEFNKFITNPTCPKVVTIPYERIKARVKQRKMFVEPVSVMEPVSYNTFSYDIDSEVQDAVNLASTFADGGIDNGLDDMEYDLGVEYEWDVPTVKVRCTSGSLPKVKWFQTCFLTIFPAVNVPAGNCRVACI